MDKMDRVNGKLVTLRERRAAGCDRRVGRSRDVPRVKAWPRGGARIMSKTVAIEGAPHRIRCKLRTVANHSPTKERAKMIENTSDLQIERRAHALWLTIDRPAQNN